MIVICDREDSGRARSLRERIFRRGIPAATAAPTFVKDLLPAVGIVTWTDCFDELRRTSCDHVFAAVIGDGFVNTALNAASAGTGDDALRLMSMNAAKKFDLPPDSADAFGFYLAPRLYFAEGFVEWRERQIVLTKTERMILLYLAACQGEPADARKIARFCFPEGRQEGELDNRIAAHIHRVNRKFLPAADFRVIREKRGAGYFADGRLLSWI